MSEEKRVERENDRASGAGRESAPECDVGRERAPECDVGLENVKERGAGQESVTENGAERERALPETDVEAAANAWMRPDVSEGENRRAEASVRAQMGGVQMGQDH